MYNIKLFKLNDNLFAYFDRCTLQGRGDYNYGKDIGVHWVELVLDEIQFRKKYKDCGGVIKNPIGRFKKCVIEDAKKIYVHKLFNK